jgi:DNA processing protein
MALVCHATVIVEAGQSSGTMHQGWEALRLGRALFLMKSLVEATDVTWTAEMIEHGAMILTDTDQVMEFLPDVDAPEAAQHAALF